jgi:proteasome lid subunit RPN8/RPN11
MLRDLVQYIAFHDKLIGSLPTSQEIEENQNEHMDIKAEDERLGSWLNTAGVTTVPNWLSDSDRRIYNEIWYAYAYLQGRSGMGSAIFDENNFG